MTRIYLNASELAGITGHNQWKDSNEIGEQILIRNKLKKGELIRNDIQKKLSSIHDEELLDALKKELKLPKTTTKNELEKHIKKTYITPLLKTKKEKDSHTQQKNMMTNTPLTQKIFSQAAHSDLIKKRGNVKEEQALNRSEAKNNVKITSRNSKMYTKVLYEDDNYTILLRGKVDGIENDDTIVESKNRSKRLFMKIPEYEKVQLEAYMFLTGLTTARHIENYNETSNEIMYTHNNEFWEMCKNTIIEFVLTLVDN